MKRVGLALSSGAARGIAHIGVLAVLEREGIPVDFIAGTSMGALIGAFYAAGRTAKEIEEVIVGVTRKKMRSFFDFTLSGQGIIRGERVIEWLRYSIDNAEFSDLRIPFACVAADIHSGEKVVIEDGSVAEGVRASVSIPVLYMPFSWRGRHLVDGGLVDPVPVDVVRDMGADFVIASTVTPDKGKQMSRLSIAGVMPEKPPGIFRMWRLLRKVRRGEVTATGAARADIVIAPDVRGMRLRPGDRRRVAELVSAGEHAAIKAIPEIRRELGI